MNETDLVILMDSHCVRASVVKPACRFLEADPARPFARIMQQNAENPAHGVLGVDA